MKDMTLFIQIKLVYKIELNNFLGYFETLNLITKEVWIF